MKRFPFAMLTAVLLFVLIGCSAGDVPSDSGAAGSAALREDTGGSAPAPAETEEALSKSVEPEEAPSKSFELGQAVRPSSSGGITGEAIPVYIDIGEKTFSAVLYDSDSAQALAEQFPLALHMSELNGNEKYYYLESDLPAAPEKPGQLHTGDIMLFGSDCLVLFYESFSSGYSYTRLGSVDDPAELAEALGTGNVTVTFRTE